MGILSDFALKIAPNWSAQRERSRLLAMHYRAARLGRRSDSLRPSRDGADRAGADRARVAAYVRDMIRNTPFAKRGQAVIARNVIGDGILPKLMIRGKLSDKARNHLKTASLEMIEDHLDTTAIDAAGLLNLYGLQNLAIATIVDSGEVLVRRHHRKAEHGSIPLQIEVLEPDHIDSSKFGVPMDGHEIRDGIEYDAQGCRVAYWLFTQHPGADWMPGKSGIQSERVSAEDILHIFDVSRAGQSRGVSWFAPVAEKLMHYDDFEDAQLMRQKIAACFAAFRQNGNDGEAKKIDLGAKLEPGTIMDIGADDQMFFSDPPSVGDYDPFTKGILRAGAMGLGITYEAFSGDLSNVNFSSARIGRLEMDRNISAWQWLMMIPMMMQPLGRWIMQAWGHEEEALWEQPDHVKISFSWVPPVRIMVDPAREYSALNEAVRSGFHSRQGVVRQLGVDPERLAQEQAEDKAEADRLGLIFDSDPRRDAARMKQVSAAGYAKDDP